MAQSGTKIAGVRETRKGATIYKTNERPGTRAQVKYVRVSAYKAREVLDLIRGLPVRRADEVLQFTDRAVSVTVRKVLASAVANAVHNEGQDPDELFVKACFADEGPTLRRFSPRAARSLRQLLFPQRVRRLGRSCARAPAVGLGGARRPLGRDAAVCTAVSASSVQLRARAGATAAERAGARLDRSRGARGAATAGDRITVQEASRASERSGSGWIRVHRARRPAHHRRRHVRRRRRRRHRSR